jgi:ankyrin repeat protein
MVRTDSAHTTKVLIEAGAKHNQPIADGSLPIHWASASGDQEKLSILLDRYKKDDPQELHNALAARSAGGSPLYIAGFYGNQVIAKQLLKAGANANDPFEQKTLLHLTVADGQLYLSKLLLKHQADPNARNGHGETPLHYGIFDKTMTALLVEAGGELTVPDDTGETPLHAFMHGLGELANDGVHPSQENLDRLSMYLAQDLSY